MTKGGAADYSRHFSVPVVMSIGEAEHISTAVVYTKASHLGILVYELSFLGCNSYDDDNLKYESSRIIIDHEATISMTKYNKDTVGNRHVTRRYDYVRQGTTLKEHVF